MAGVGDDDPALSVLDEGLVVGFDGQVGEGWFDDFGEDWAGVGSVACGFVSDVGQAGDDAGVGAQRAHEQEVGGGSVGFESGDSGAGGVVFLDGIENGLRVRGHVEGAGEEVFVSGGEMVEGAVCCNGGGGDSEDCAVASDDDQGLGVFEGFGVEGWVGADGSAGDGDVGVFECFGGLVGAGLGFTGAGAGVVEDNDGHGGG